MVNIEDNNIYQLLYCNNGKLFKINDWIDKEVIKTENAEQADSDVYFSKITQLHTGQFLYLNDKCEMFICDYNFQNSKKFDIVINDYTIKINAMCQLSNYKILVSAENRLYMVESVNTPDLKFEY